MNKKAICKYFKLFIDFIPTTLESFDTSRIIILQFSLSGLNILDSLDTISDTRKQELIDWIYGLQDTNGGFRGGYFPTSFNPVNKDYMSCHVTMTYSCLTCLLILGDDLSRVNKPLLVKSFSQLLSRDGCFRASLDCPESDVRFIYSAIVSCYLINDFSGLDIDAVVNFVSRCQDISGGFGQHPLEEAHGGSTYCALASLKLLGKLDFCLPPNSYKRNKLLHWLVMRQKEGFHGRPHKDDDSCYTFWVGASLKMLGHADFVDMNSLLKFLEKTFDETTGGFCKLKSCGGYADPLHTYLSLAGLSSLLYCQSSSESSTHSIKNINTDSISQQTIDLIHELKQLDPTLNLTSCIADSIHTNNLLAHQLMSDVVIKDN